MPPKLHLTKKIPSVLKKHLLYLPLSHLSLSFTLSLSFCHPFSYVFLKPSWLKVKFESIHGVFGLFRNFSHMAILISAHSTEDKQIII